LAKNVPFHNARFTKGNVLQAGMGCNLDHGMVTTTTTNAILSSLAQAQSDKIRLLEAVIDNFPGGLLLFDSDLKLVLCNAQQRRLLDYPDSLFANGSPSLQQIFAFNASRGEYGAGSVEDHVRVRMELVAKKSAHVFERKRPNGTVLEIRGMPLAGGGFVTTYLDVTDQRKNQELIAHLAHHDQLTDLPNRTLMLDRLHIALAGVRRGRKVALHYIDLDRFKPVNDSFGHDVGDIVLKTVASRLISAVRETDTIARIGGDEFVVIQVDVEIADDAEIVASRIIESISKTRFHESSTVSVSASIGIAFAPWDGSSPEELLRKADQAMYRSKSQGGSAFNFYSSPPKLRRGVENVLAPVNSHMWVQDLN
jgi:diguanylate cyclase (GGDEF)-like protein